MKKAGFDEYTHEARELFDNSLAQIDRDAAITLAELKERLENDATFTKDGEAVNYLESSQKKKSYIYIAENPSFKCPWIKIGETTDVKSRFGVLHSSTPELFNILYRHETPFEPKCNKGGSNTSTRLHRKMEKYLHTRYHHVRAPNGEFFLVDPHKAYQELLELQQRVDKQLKTHPIDIEAYLDSEIDCAQKMSRMEAKNET
tara:strand:+ start:1834 stop:2439 length:606 start_codon:yes stop_codon:yes gene_type:complete